MSRANERAKVSKTKRVTKASGSKHSRADEIKNIKKTPTSKDDQKQERTANLRPLLRGI